MPQGLRSVSLIAAAFVAAVMPWTFVAEAETGDERRIRQTAGLRAVAGHWVEMSDGGPVLRADATQWKGETTTAAAQTASREVFGSLNDTFVRNVTAPGAFPLAVAAGSDFSSGTIRVQFRLVSGQTDQTAGVVFGLRPDGEYHYLRYNTKDGNLAVWRFLEGERQVIVHGTEHAEIKLGTWQELIVTISGAAVRGALANHPKVTVDHTFATPITGRVGLWTKRDSVTDFRQFVATPGKR
jgi:hypothetical protein